MAARPPFLGIRLGTHERVFRMVLPRAVDRLGPRRNHHMPSRRTRRAAHGRDDIEIFAVTRHLGAFGRKAFDDPLLGIVPGIVSVFGRADTLQAVVRQAHAVAAGEKQPARAVLTDRVARIDVARQIEVDGIAPRPGDLVRPDDVDRGLGALAGLLGRDVEEIAAIVLFQADRPHRSDVFGKRRRQRLPIHQVAAVPDGAAGIGFEGREGHVVVGAIFQNRRIGMVAGHDRIEESATPEIGLALAFEGFRPGGGRFRSGRLGLGDGWKAESQGAQSQRLQSGAAAGGHGYHPDPGVDQRC